MLRTCLLAALWAVGSLFTQAAAGDAPWLDHRPDGIPTSMFGVHIQAGELIAYPFFEYYLNSNEEYKPEDFGHGQAADYRGRFTASEELLYLAYAWSDRWMVEMEAALMQAELKKADADQSTMPERLSESGLGDVEGQVRARWNRETASRPMYFSYLEVVAPTQGEGSLIGTTDWEFKLGSGLTKGLAWGSCTARAAVEYDRAEGKSELGEMAVEVQRRLGPAWQLYGGLEGKQDEWELVLDFQYRPGKRLTVKLNNGFGITSKAVDWAPEVGLLFRLGGR